MRADVIVILARVCPLAALSQGRVKVSPLAHRRVPEPGFLTRQSWPACGQLIAMRFGNARVAMTGSGKNRELGSIPVITIRLAGQAALRRQYLLEYFGGLHHLRGGSANSKIIGQIYPAYGP